MPNPAGVLYLVLPLILVRPAQAQAATAVSNATPTWATSGGIYDGQMTFGWSSGSYANLAPDAWTSTPTFLAEATPTSSLQGTNAPPASASATSLAGSIPQTTTPSGSWTKFDTVVVAHAVLGSLAWMILSPCIILLSRYAAPPSSLTWSISGFVFLLTVATVALGGAATNLAGVKHFGTAHQRMGLSLLILLILQCILVLWAEQQRRRRPTKATALPQQVHILGGTLLTAIGFAQVYLGVNQYALRSGRDIPLAVIVIWAIITGLFSLYLISLAVRHIWATRPSSRHSNADSTSKSWQYIQSPHSSMRDHDSLVSVSASTVGSIQPEMAELPQADAAHRREELPLHQSLGFLPLTHLAPLATIEESPGNDRSSHSSASTTQSSRQERVSVIPTSSPRRVSTGVKRKAVPPLLEP